MSTAAGALVRTLLVKGANQRRVLGCEFSTAQAKEPNQRQRFGGGASGASGASGGRRFLVGRSTDNGRCSLSAQRLRLRNWEDNGRSSGPTGPSANRSDLGLAAGGRNSCLGPRGHGGSGGGGSGSTSRGTRRRERNGTGSVTHRTNRLRQGPMGREVLGSSLNPSHRNSKR